MMQDAFALAPVATDRPAPTPDEDWLTMPEADLEAMHAESLALILRPGSTALATRSVASLAVLHQVMLARTVIRALGMPPGAARAAMRSSYALGYLFGLASGCGDEGDSPPSERRIASTLMMLHDLVYGREAAERLNADLVASGTEGVGDAFADGMLAAGADLADLARWRGGAGGALPCRLLDGLHLAGWRREAAGDRRH